VKIVVATGNLAKAAEFEAMWPGTGVDRAPDGFSPEETGTTLFQNAWIKAAALRGGADPDAVVLADDSGLVVRSLGGRPGVFSARYAGDDATDEDNCRRLLQDLEGEGDRRAAFVCVLVALAPGDRMLVASGCCPGDITTAMRGEQGFGYDPVFVPRGERRSMAQMTRDEKAAISHRGRAARRMSSLLGLAAA
jgi:XTP/dITP diphosphohydrolase